MTEQKNDDIRGVSAGHWYGICAMCGEIFCMDGNTECRAVAPEKHVWEGHPDVQKMYADATKHRL